MKKCLIIINSQAGSSKKISFDRVEHCLGKAYQYHHCTLPNDNFCNLEKYDAIAICGGDGTLSSILEKVYNKDIDVFYFPAGTLNDKAKASRYQHTKTTCKEADYLSGKPIIIGKCNALINEGNYTTIDCQDHIFTYVFAAGSFTPIGYTAKVEMKKRFGILAYIKEVIKEYHPHYIDATIQYNNKYVTDNFTLIMYLKSPRCFGFNFNGDFNPESTSGHLIAIRSPKSKGIAKYVEMFFTFFRVFFIGLKEEIESRRIIYKKVYSSTITLNDNIDFCKDGERLAVDKGQYKICFKRSLCDFNIIDKC